MRTILYIIISLSICNSLSAQDLAPGFKSWATLGLDMRVSKKSSIAISNLTSIDNRSFTLGFMQTNAEMKVRLNNRFAINGGYKLSIFGIPGNIRLYHRVFVAPSIKHDLGIGTMSHTVNSEFHFPALRKYKYRLIYTIRYGVKLKFLPWKGKLYAKGELYYYLGGRPINYYSDNGDFIAKNSPNDFHRYRTGLGLRMKPSRNLRLSVYYMWQQEINSGLNPTRNINVPNSGGNKIQLPFNNYSVVGVFLGYRLDLRKKRNNQKSSI